MTRKRFSEEDILGILRQIDLDLASGGTVETAVRSAGISDATYYKWRKLYGGMGKSQLRMLKDMEKENARLKRIVAELELDKLILKDIPVIILTGKKPTEDIVKPLAELGVQGYLVKPVTSGALEKQITRALA
jgi:putative transposase